MKHILYTDSKKKLVNVEKRYFPQAFRIAEISQLRFLKVKLCESCLLYFTIRYFPTHLEKMKRISGVLTLDFVLFFFFLPAHHTSCPFFTEAGCGFGHKLRSLRWRRSQVWSDVAWRRRAILYKSTGSFYYLLSKVSERIGSWLLQSWFIRRICAMFLELNITIYNCSINEVEE